MNSIWIKSQRYWYFGLTIFVSAFLLFQIQPMISKYILPWFGGGPAVWTTSQVFFQVLLLGGYGYAHALSRMKLKTQSRLHVAALLGILVWVIVMGVQWGTPVTPDASWKPMPGAFPAWQVLAVLAVSVGLPYFLLSTTSSLIQAWFGRLYQRESPYAFYILSNAASLIALLSYPVVFEPTLTLHEQGWFWTIGFGIYLAVLAFSTIQVMRCNVPEAPAAVMSEAKPQPVEPEGTLGSKPGTKEYLYWISLAACGTVMSLATTNQLTQDVASMPFLWVLPLSLYLLSFIVGFNDRLGRYRGLLIVLMILALASGLLIIMSPAQLPLWGQLLLNSFTMFVVCLFCHNELYMNRPNARYLTSFYLMLSLGGALGGVLVSMIAPVFFLGFWEYPLGLLFCADLIVSLAYRKNGGWLYKLRIPVTVVTLVLAVGLVLWPMQTFSASLHVSRNFYGLQRVREVMYGSTPTYTLVNGAIVHGMQPVNDPAPHRPLSYYPENSGVGLAILNHPKRLSGEPMRVGIIGLGAGTLTVYGKPGDTYRFYEIDPKVIEVAYDTRFFTYLRDTPATVEIVEGDARLMMERELAEGGSQQYDIFVIDAFSGDSIPAHLLSKEAVELYLAHLKPGGVLAFHISNKYIDLKPVVARTAEVLNLRSALIQNSAPDELSFSSWWALLANDGTVLDKEVLAAASQSLETRPDVRLWTDDYSNIFQVLRIR